MTNGDIAELSEAIREKKGWFIALGVLFIIVGIICIAYPLMATVTAKIFIGWMVLFGGIAQVIQAFSTKTWGGFIWNVLVGFLYLFVGAWLAFFPLAGIISLTLLLALMFIAEGVMKLILGFGIRPKDGWFWAILSGAVSLIVGVMLVANLPGTSVWAIGTLVGINFLFAGWSFIAMPMFAKGIATGN